MATPPDVIERLLAWARVDLGSRHQPRYQGPQWWRLALATVLAVGLSLAADAALVAVGTKVFPTTAGYVHFQFSDYAKLTVAGVLIACAGWPIVARISSAPRWLFFRLAIAVTLVLFLPDVFIWLQGQSAQAVAVLMAMHVAIAVITYNLLVHVAPVRRRRGDPRGAPGRARATVASGAPAQR